MLHLQCPRRCSGASGVQGALREGLAGAAAALEDRDGGKEVAVEARCADAFQAVLLFERTHCLTLQVRQRGLCVPLCAITDGGGQIGLCASCRDGAYLAARMSVELHIDLALQSGHH